MSETPPQMPENADRKNIKKSLALAEMFGIGSFKKRHRYAAPSADIAEVAADALVSAGSYKVVFTDNGLTDKGIEMLKKLQESMDGRDKPPTDMFTTRAICSGLPGTGKSELAERIRQMLALGQTSAANPVNAPKP